ncbi:hypothetical protein ADL09_06095 [Streptomyces sp. NRRL F-7442]|nr:hypothetical protein ADL09_06095 [Streptomyces sp. NRRL F-7442]
MLAAVTAVHRAIRGRKSRAAAPDGSAAPDGPASDGPASDGPVPDGPAVPDVSPGSVRRRPVCGDAAEAEGDDGMGERLLRAHTCN